ncbi:hypothetical protein [Thermodesulfitimonas autotrophica]|jgi:hypothetical protein|uniref:hypothetical protein n=1 Tax=Thermodesulfitimonas autotrophica TaxID=1894989 RepID=UPI00157BB6A9
MVTREEIEKVLKALVGQVFPVLNGALYPVKGKVIKTYNEGRQADVRVLDSSGNALSSWPVLAKLRVPGNQTVQTGDQVRIGFYYADPSQPYIDEVLK